MWVHWLRSPDLMTLRNHLQQYLETEAAERNVPFVLYETSMEEVCVREKFKPSSMRLSICMRRKGSDK